MEATDGSNDRSATPRTVMVSNMSIWSCQRQIFTIIHVTMNISKVSWLGRCRKISQSECIKNSANLHICRGIQQRQQAVCFNSRD